MNDTTWWYLARSGGIVAWVVLAMSMFWGLALSTKVFRGKPRPNWLLDLHRFLGGLGVVFTAIHVVAMMVHKFARFSLGDALIPKFSGELPGGVAASAVAWGITGFYVLLAVEVTSLLRRRLSKRSWKAVHYLSFPLFAMATIHGLTAGTDRHHWLFVGVAVVAIVAVVILTVVRVADAERYDLMNAPAISPPQAGRDRR